ncbi:Splicing factor YJU2 [Linum grandiflorum]
MGEPKHYLPDFDDMTKRRRVRPPRNLQIRIMLPMSIRCNTCGIYIDKGTKFDSRKEDVIGETYLGLDIFRFYFNCTGCSAELAMKSDPQNSDFVMESGATRDFEPSTEDVELDAEEMDDSMKLDFVIALLDEAVSTRSREAILGVDAMVEALQLEHGAAMQPTDSMLGATSAGESSRMKDSDSE